MVPVGNRDDVALEPQLYKSLGGQESHHLQCCSSFLACKERCANSFDSLPARPRVPDNPFSRKLLQRILPKAAARFNFSLHLRHTSTTPPTSFTSPTSSTSPTSTASISRTSPTTYTPVHLHHIHHLQTLPHSTYITYNIYISATTKLKQCYTDIRHLQHQTVAKAFISLPKLFPCHLHRFLHRSSLFLHKILKKKSSSARLSSKKGS